MIRETKAERLAREAEENTTRQRIEQERAAHEYPTRMMTALESAIKVNFEITVRDAEFVLWDRDEYKPEAFYLSPVYSVDSYNRLVDLEYAVNEKEKTLQEQQRRYNVRQAALAKLTDEERKLLNL